MRRGILFIICLMLLLTPAVTFAETGGKTAISNQGEIVIPLEYDNASDFICRVLREVFQ
jgi:hypothetical protein